MHLTSFPHPPLTRLAPTHPAASNESRVSVIVSVPSTCLSQIVRARAPVCMLVYASVCIEHPGVSVSVSISVYGSEIAFAGLFGRSSHSPDIGSRAYITRKAHIGSMAYRSMPYIAPAATCLPLDLDFSPALPCAGVSGSGAGNAAPASTPGGGRGGF